MEIKITGQKTEISPALKDHIHNKIEKLNRHFEKIIWIHVVLKIEKNKQIAEANMHASGHDFFAQADHHDMYESIDNMIAKLDAQVLKHKDKIKKSQHKST